MLFRVHTGWEVEKCDQSEIIYLVAVAQDIKQAGIPFVFTDRHTLVTQLVSYFDSLDQISKVDFKAAYAELWGQSVVSDPRLEEKKQAEFLVHRQLPWELIPYIGVLNKAVDSRVQAILSKRSRRRQPKIVVRPDLYY